MSSSGSGGSSGGSNGQQAQKLQEPELAAAAAAAAPKHDGKPGVYRGWRTGDTAIKANAHRGSVERDSRVVPRGEADLGYASSKGGKRGDRKALGISKAGWSRHDTAAQGGVGSGAVGANLARRRGAAKEGEGGGEDLALTLDMVKAMGAPAAGQQHRVAMVMPYVGDALPAWFDLFALTADASAALLDWLILCPPHLAHIATPPSVKHPYWLVEFKPVLGWILRDYLINYTHWGFGDMDIIFGHLANGWLPAEELNQWDFISFSFGDQYRAYLRGQLTIQKNTPKANNVWRLCKHFSQYMQRIRQEPPWGPLMRFSGEGCCSWATRLVPGLKVLIPVRAGSDVAHKEQKQGWGQGQG
ncbi:hypothetical protein JKP88DRAFT_314666 [Tribonema minus]|uniref:Uncharacterized protein n=1 Tax=Tribonema minus TaxID=303371 RepID=A0A835Z713_9STRA|nr:hypothetical protein JKP88DRAFT_314666 [Tribonema minus]